LPLSVEYLYNDDLKESSNLRVLFDMVFWSILMYL
jgi:hypothetical protein